jgi:hypothetical protein
VDGVGSAVRGDAEVGPGVIAGPRQRLEEQGRDDRERRDAGQ